MQLEDTRQPCSSHCFLGSPFPPSLSASVLVLERISNRASWSIQSLPFLEGFLPGALWAAGIRGTVGSFVSKKETASWERRVGRDGQEQEELEHKNAECSWVLLSAVLSLAELGEWGRIFISLRLGGAVKSCRIFWTRKVKSRALFPVADAVSLPLTCETERIRRKLLASGSCFRVLPGPGWCLCHLS